jgi:hypothetical protein
MQTPRQRRSVNRVNAAPRRRATLEAMNILAMVGLIVSTLALAHLLWLLLLRAEQRYAQLEGHGQTAADIAGIAFLGLAGMIVLGASTALLLEARGLIHALLL